MENGLPSPQTSVCVSALTSVPICIKLLTVPPTGSGEIGENKCRLEAFLEPFVPQRSELVCICLSEYERSTPQPSRCPLSCSVTGRIQMFEPLMLEWKAELRSHQRRPGLCLYVHVLPLPSFCLLQEIRNIHNEELMGIRREEEMEMSDDDMEDVPESKDSDESGTEPSSLPPQPPTFLTLVSEYDTHPHIVHVPQNCCDKQVMSPPCMTVPLEKSLGSSFSPTGYVKFTIYWRCFQLTGFAAVSCALICRITHCTRMTWSKS